MRELGVRTKLNALTRNVRGKRLILVDDSIVRGTTSRKIVEMLRTAGAKEVHMRISSPSVLNPCYFGIDTATSEELDRHSRALWKSAASSERTASSSFPCPICSRRWPVRAANSARLL